MRGIFSKWKRMRSAYEDLRTLAVLWPAVERVLKEEIDAFLLAVRRKSEISTTVLQFRWALSRLAQLALDLKRDK